MIDVFFLFFIFIQMYMYVTEMRCIQLLYAIEIS